MVRSALFPQHATMQTRRPDPIRIVGIAGAIAANVALFAFLMQPMSYSPPAEPESVPVTFPDPLKKPEVVKFTPEPKPHPRPTPAPPRPLPPQPEPPKVVATDTGPMDTRLPPGPPPTTDTGTQNPAPQPTGPVEIGLKATASPAPIYPTDALRDGVTGTVQLDLLVGADGRVLTAIIAKSSGDRRLDAAAREQVLRNWRFQPAMVNGVPVPAHGILPIAFNLNGP